jgi:nucleoid DNA-binding protein
MSSGASGSALTKRLAKKLGVSVREAGRLKRAFVETLKEEVEARYAEGDTPANKGRTDLVISGLGSFKMRTRPERKFCAFRYAQGKSVFGEDGPRETVTKPAASRLVFTSKWEPLP